jgi:hypothetical protein
MQPTKHIFVGAKAPWFEITDDLPQFEDKYIAEIGVTRPYFDATPDSSDQAVAAELSRHAVFRLIPAR